VKLESARPSKSYSNTSGSLVRNKQAKPRPLDLDDKGLLRHSMKLFGRINMDVILSLGFE
jgi:hypothetical protein